MLTPVGQDWSRLPPLELSKQALTEIFDIVRRKKEYFIWATARTLNAGPENWPCDAIQRAQKHIQQFGWIADLFEQREKAGVPLWEQLAEDLAKDPDYRTY